MFSRIDLLGKSVEFNFNGKDKSRSSAGAWFTLFFLGFIVWSIYELGKDLINHQEPKTIMSDSFVEDPLPMALSPETFNFGFGLQHSTTLAHYINESIYTVQVTRDQLRRSVKDDGTIEMKWTYTPLLVERCSKQHFGVLATRFENMELNDLYCLQTNQPELENIQIQGVLESPLFEGVSVKIRQCDNQTSRVPCAPKEILDELLGGGWFTTHFTNLAIQPKNFNHPNLRYRDSFHTSMSNTFSKQLTLWLSHVEVITDSGWVIEELRKDCYTKVDHVHESTTFRPNTNEMMSFVIRADKMTRNYQRSYIKAQDLIANLNGLASISIIVGYIFLMPYSKIKFYERLINELFDVKLMKNKDKNYSKKRTRPISAIIVDGDKPENEEKEEVAQNSLLEKPGNNSGSLPAFPQRFGKSPWSNTKILDPPNHSCKIPSPLCRSQPKLRRKKKSFTNIHSNMKVLEVNTSHSDEEIEEDTLPKKALGPIKEESSPKDHSIPPLMQEKPKIMHPPHIKFPTTIEIHSQGETFIALEIITEKPQLVESQEDPNIAKKSNQVSLHNNLGTMSNLNLASRIEKTKKEITTKVIDEKEIAKRAEILPDQLTKDSYHINITFLDYIRSYFWRTNHINQKFNLLKEGIRRIEERLNIFNLLKKLREIDKLKLLLLENEQFILFDGLPNPELSSNHLNKKTRSKRSSVSKLKEAMFVANKWRHDLIKSSYINLKSKRRQTLIDQKLLEIYDEIIDL